MEEYFKILEEIENKKIDITRLYILKRIEYEDKEKIEKMNYIYDMWLEIDEDIDLCRLCDIVCGHWEEIQNEEYDYDDIIIDLFN